jgi:hypothetical protein
MLMQGIIYSTKYLQLTNKNRRSTVVENCNIMFNQRWVDQTSKYKYKTRQKAYVNRRNQRILERCENIQ